MLVEDGRFVNEPEDIEVPMPDDLSVIAGPIAKEVMKSFQPRSGRRLKLATRSGRLSWSEPVSRIAVKRKDECKFQ